MAKNRLRIPKEFELLGHTIIIEWNDNLEFDEEAYGLAECIKNKIILQKPNKQYGVTQVEETFLHEVIHLIFDNTSHRKESKNEILVDIIASLIHQMLISAKYTKENDLIMKIKSKK